MSPMRCWSVARSATSGCGEACCRACTTVERCFRSHLGGGIRLRVARARHFGGPAQAPQRLPPPLGMHAVARVVVIHAAAFGPRSDASAATGAEGSLRAGSQITCQWLRATGSMARRWRVSNSSTARCAWIECRFGMPSLYTRILMRWLMGGAVHLKFLLPGCSTGAKGTNKEDHSQRAVFAAICGHG
jgi:hypothetical protein